MASMSEQGGLHQNSYVDWTRMSDYLIIRLDFFVQAQRDRFATYLEYHQHEFRLKSDTYSIEDVVQYMRKRVNSHQSRYQSHLVAEQISCSSHCLVTGSHIESCSIHLFQSFGRMKNIYMTSIGCYSRLTDYKSTFSRETSGTRPNCLYFVIHPGKSTNNM